MMADDREEVVYSFEGDTSALKKATQDAINLLGKFDSAIKSVASKDTFSASKTSAVGFQRTLNGLVKQVNSLTASLNTTGSSIGTDIPNGATLVQDATKDLADVLDYLDQTSNITSSDLKFLNDVLKTTRANLEPVISRAQMLSTSLKPLTTLQVDTQLNSAGQAAQTAERHFERAASAGFRVQEAYVASGKSAAESATVFLKAAKSAEKMNSVQGIVRRVQTEFNMLGAKARQAWDKFASRIDPTGVKLQSFRDKANKAMSSVRKATAQVSSAFRRTSTAVSDTSEAASAAGGKTAALASAMSSLQNRANRSTNSFNKLTRSLKSLSNMAVRLIAVRLGQWLTSAAKQSIDFAENLNLFNVAMGESVAVGKEFVNQMAEVYGMDPSNLMRYAGNFYQLTDAIDMPSESASKLSLSLLKATNDMSSLFNVPIEEVFEDLSSGMQGMTRAVRKYGIDIRNTTLQQTALSLGITGSVDSMTEANRQGLRFITMMKQASNASGDFAKTIESPANQLKVFKEQMTQLGRAIGDLFVGSLATAIQYVNGFIMALRMIIVFVRTALGIVTDAGNSGSDTMEDVSGSVDDLGDSAAATTKKLRAMVSPLDELNVIGQQDTDIGLDVGTLDPEIQKAIEDMELSLESIRMKANKIRDKLLEFLGFKFEGGIILSWDSSALEENLINKLPQWTQTIQATFDNWTSIMNAFGNVFSALGDIAKIVLKRIAKIFKIDDKSLASLIEDLDDKLNDFADTLRNNKDTIADFTIVFGGLILAFKTIAGISSVLAPIVQVLMQITQLIGPASTAVGFIAAVIASIAVLHTTSEEFATSFDNLIRSVVEGLGTIFTAAWSAISTMAADIGTSITPMFTSIGDSFVPVVANLESLWGNVVAIVTDACQTIERMWNTTLKPVYDAMIKAVQVYSDVYRTLWEQVLGPVIGHIGDGIESLWKTTLRPIAENIAAVIGGIIELVLNLWNYALGPMLKWLTETFGPVITNIAKWIWDIVQQVIEGIGGLINGLLTVLRGIIDFISGVFAGDWDRAWRGIVEIFEGIWNMIVEIVKFVFNGVIGLLNGVLGAISGAINGIINAINKISVTVPDWVPGIGGKKFGFDLPGVGNWQIPYLASGGVVTSPTMAMIGEGKHDEAVIPLGNSPQMKDLVNQIAEATRSKGSNEPIQVNVYIGNEQVAEYTHRAEKRRQLQTNGGT